jgi:hypothetical protein
VFENPRQSTNVSYQKPFIIAKISAVKTGCEECALYIGPYIVGTQNGPMSRMKISIYNLF